jgi:hypothetical protein
LTRLIILPTKSEALLSSVVLRGVIRFGESVCLLLDFPRPSLSPLASQFSLHGSRFFVFIFGRILYLYDKGAPYNMPVKKVSIVESDALFRELSLLIEKSKQKAISLAKSVPLIRYFGRLAKG